MALNLDALLSPSWQNSTSDGLRTTPGYAEAPTVVQTVSVSSHGVCTLLIFSISSEMFHF